jgi:effector-binding domain-containing protein
MLYLIRTRKEDREMKVIVLDETGHTELAVETIAELKEKVNLKDKFVFADGNFINQVTLDGITEMPREIVVTDSLIGG